MDLSEEGDPDQAILSNRGPEYPSRRDCFDLTNILSSCMDEPLMLETYAVAEKTLGMLHEGLTSRARVPELQLWHTVKIRETEYRLFFLSIFITQ